MLKVYLEEEYGLRHWCWEYPGAKDELIADWKAGKAPLETFTRAEDKHQPKGNFRGVLTELTLDDVEIHHHNPKYRNLWVRGTGKMREEERSKIFNAPEYKKLQEQYKKDLDEKWPIRGHLFYDETYLMVDGIRYKPR